MITQLTISLLLLTISLAAHAANEMVSKLIDDIFVYMKNPKTMKVEHEYVENVVNHSSHYVW